MIRGAFETSVSGVNQTGHLEPQYVADVPSTDTGWRLGSRAASKTMRSRPVVAFVRLAANAIL
jgi:hypothetical protein